MTGKDDPVLTLALPRKDDLHYSVDRRKIGLWQSSPSWVRRTHMFVAPGRSNLRPAPVGAECSGRTDSCGPSACNAASPSLAGTLGRKRHFAFLTLLSFSWLPICLQYHKRRTLPDHSVANQFAVFILQFSICYP